MKRTSKLFIVLLLTLTGTTGCWNMKEPNEIAFVMGSGLDLTKDGQYQLSTLIAVPAGIGGGQMSGGSEKKSFSVVSATGKDNSDAAQNLQAQLSRSLFPGHRLITLIGQRMAEKGINDLVDEFFRNPQSGFRTRVFAVKDGQAKDVFTIESYFDPYITTTLMTQLDTLGLKHYYFRDFLSDTLSQGIQPQMPAIKLNDLGHYSYAGTAVFNKQDGLKLVGFLNPEESSYANWITGRQTEFVITSNIPQGNGNISLKLKSLGHRIHVKTINGQMHLAVQLTGNGTIVENNTDFDPTKLKDFQFIQDKLNQRTQKSIQQLIKKVQRQYKADIFGFGQSIHQKYPYQWKALKRNWDKTFPELPVSVKVDLQFDSISAGSSIKVSP